METGRKNGKSNFALASAAAGAAAVCMLFLWNIGASALLDYDEAAYAEVVRETAQSGSRMTLYFIGEPWFDKPPLYFWAAWLLQAAFSAEAAMRLAPALSGIAAVAAAALIAWHFTKSGAASALSAAALSTIAAFVGASRQARLDAPVAALIAFGYLFFLKGLASPRWFVAFGVAAGAAVMTKGAVGLLLYPACLLAALSLRSFGWLRSPWFWAGQLCAAAIVIPWYAHQTVAFGKEFWEWHLGVHVVSRYGSDLIGGNSSVLIYLSHLAYFAMPWAAVFALSACAVFASWNRLRMEEKNSFLAVLVPLSALAAIFVTARTKVTFYLVPLYPFMAVLIALSFDMLYRRLQGRDKKLIAAFASVLVIFGMSSAVFRGLGLDPRFNIEQRLAEDEREIGQLLRDLDPDKPILFSDPIYWETVRFYSGGRALGRYDGRAGDYFLVVPTYKLNHFAEYKAVSEDARTVYRGTYFTLLET